MQEDGDGDAAAETDYGCGAVIVFVIHSVILKPSDSTEFAILSANPRSA